MARAWRLALILGAILPLLTLADASAAGTNPVSSAALIHEFNCATNLETKRAILHGLGVLRDGAAADLLVTLLGNPGSNTELCSEAIAAARQVSSIFVTDALIILSRAAVPTNILIQTLDALGHKGATDAIPALVPHLRSSDWLVRETAIGALIRCGGHPTINAVLPLLDDASPDTRRAAVRVLASFKHPRIVDPLLKAWVDPETESEAVAGLANVPDVRALDAYLAGLGSANISVRLKCRQAIGRIHSEALPLLEAKASGLPLLTLRELQFIYEHDPKARGGPLFNSPR
jgi:HEAT repeat protein